jgi:two-component system chemotaxis response regulator CheY
VVQIDMAKILVVDDAAFMRMMIKDTLNKLGYDDVEEAPDGAVAVEKFQQLNPDLVMLDITMPNLDGIGALKAIKELDPSSKVVMCSAMGQEAMVVEAIKLGALDFIVKPFKPDRIAKTMKAVLG